MLRLVGREDLHKVKVVEGARGLGFRRERVVRERRDDVQRFEHVAREVRRVGSGRERERDRAHFAGMDYGRDGRVEREGFAPSAVRLVWFFLLVVLRWAGGGEDVPIHAARVVVLCLHRGAHMGVNPEWPERVVQVESNEFGEREAVCEGRRCGGGILQGLGVLSFCSDHVHLQDWM